MTTSVIEPKIDVSDLRRQHRSAPVIYFHQGIAASAAIEQYHESEGQRRYREYMDEITGVTAARRRVQA